IPTYTSVTDSGITLDSSSLYYRYTPNDNWDIRAIYSHLRRTGTQVDGVIFNSATIGLRVDVPKPVADSTQNYGVSGEYAGTSFWNQKFNVKVAYSGSTSTDRANTCPVEKSLCPTGPINNTCAIAGAPSSPIAQMTSWPSNNANGVSATAGVDLPFSTRYMGTIAYTNMRQNDPFAPFTVTPFSATGGVPPGWAGVPGIPV